MHFSATGASLSGDGGLGDVSSLATASGTLVLAAAAFGRGRPTGPPARPSALSRSGCGPCWCPRGWRTR